MEVSIGKYGIIVMVFIFWLYHLLFSKPASSRKGPPEAGGGRPLTGHLHVMSTGLPHINLGNLADKHGPIFSMRLGVRRVVVVSGPDLVKELFTTHDAVVSSRPPVKSAEHLAYNGAMMGFAAYDDYWRYLRRIVSVHLFSSHRVELEKNVRISETTQSIKELYKIWENAKDVNTGRVLVDMKKWFGYLNMNVVLRMVAGKRFDCGGDDEAVAETTQVMRDFFHLAGFIVPADALPYLGWLDLGGYEKRMKRTAKEFDHVVSGWLSEHRREKAHDKARDFMDVMLTTVEPGKFDVDTIIKATCGTLIAGGTDTTTVVLIWALSLLLNHATVLNKAQQELDKHVGRDRIVNESDIKNLVYLQAITKEVLRLYPPGPLGGARIFTQDSVVGGYHIPKNTWLIVNLYKLHRDPNAWDDPLEFRPERFLVKNVDVKGRDFELIPFGAGRRICPGTGFGMQMLQLVLGRVLQAFDLGRVLDGKVDMSESDGLTNMKATPLDVVISPRLNPNLY